MRQADAMHVIAMIDSIHDGRNLTRLLTGGHAAKPGTTAPPPELTSVGAVWLQKMLPLEAEVATQAVGDLYASSSGSRREITPAMFDEAVRKRRRSEFTGYRKPSCSVCLDEAWVCVGRSGVGTDQMAPCPSCNPGIRLDGPHTRREWGPNGFWKGSEWRQTGKQTVEIGQPGGALPDADERPVSEVPEWVYVWSWLRRFGDSRPLPQQDFGDDYGTPAHPQETLDTEEYERARGRWLAAGAPRHHPSELSGIGASG